MTIRKILLHKKLLPLHALLFGYFSWLAVSYQQSVVTTITLPVYFYNQEKSARIESQESVQAILSIPRYALKHLVLQEPAIYIDASKLPMGKQTILLHSKEISLPDKANLLKLVPAHILVTLSPIES